MVLGLKVKTYINLLKKKITKNFNFKKNLDIYILSSPRFLGYVFNPISIYFCYHKKKLNILFMKLRILITNNILIIKKFNSHNLSIQ